MGYKCGECMVDFPTKKQLIEHMHDRHNSPFIEGDWKEDSKKLLEKKNDSKSVALMAKFEE